MNHIIANGIRWLKPHVYLLNHACVLSYAFSCSRLVSDWNVKCISLMHMQKNCLLIFFFINDDVTIIEIVCLYLSMINWFHRQPGEATVKESNLGRIQSHLEIVEWHNTYLRQTDRQRGRKTERKSANGTWIEIIVRVNVWRLLTQIKIQPSIVHVIILHMCVCVAVTPQFNLFVFVSYIFFRYLSLAIPHFFLSTQLNWACFTIRKLNYTSHNLFVFLLFF